MSRKANKLIKDPSVTRLLSAQTATLNGDEAAAVNYFNALSEDHETEFVRLDISCGKYGIRIRVCPE